jgi:hypothetical protein
MRFNRSLPTIGLAVGLLAGLPAPAGAATRYAAADSAVVAGDCATPSPGCRLDYAINGAVDGTEVVVQPGTYDVTTTIASTSVLTIKGQTGGSRPVIAGNVAHTKPTLDLKDSTLEFLEVTSAAPYPALHIKGGLVSNVRALAAASDAIDAKAGDGLTIRDSVFHSTAAAPSAAVRLHDSTAPEPIDVVNATAVGTGAGAIGITHGAAGPVQIVNTIARGDSTDISETMAVPDAEVSYSNYRALGSTGVNAGAGNQTATAPSFVDPAGDFHPVDGSVTEDAGTASVTLGADPDGKGRGTTPDIGAYEYVDDGASPEPPDPDPTDPDPTDPDPTDPIDPAAPTGGSTPPGTGKTGGSSTGTGGGSTGGGDEPGTLPPPAPPVLGESVGLGPVKGSVTVKLPGSGRAVPLRDGASVPVGSVIDTTRGTVKLTSVRDTSGKTQTGEFWGGVFKVGQGKPRRGRVYTDLKLVGKLSGCRAGARGKVNAAARRRWSRRRLWGRDRGGRFRTRGRHGSATVRGTQWLTEDRCKGTYFKVKQGAIVVRDNAKRKNVLVKRGRSYVARAKKTRRR